jgi:DNA-binding transcriptional LysR family regulator
MDAKFLEVYLVVVETGSIAAAARRLDSASTTIAQQIRSLESDLGARLLTRSGQTVKPTTAGLRILNRAREITRAVKDLRSEASNSTLPAGPLQLGATPTTITGLLPKALRDWRNLYENIPIHIHPGTSATLLSMVTSGELDAALMVHPNFTLPKSCEWLELRNEKLVLVTPANLKVTDPLETLVQQPYIRNDRAVVSGKLAADYLARLNLHTQVQFELELDGIEHIAQFVAEGLGVSILPDWPTTKDDPAIRRWPLPPPCPSRLVGLLWLRSSVRSQLSVALAELLRGNSAANSLRNHETAGGDAFDR